MCVCVCVRERERERGWSVSRVLSLLLLSLSGNSCTTCTVNLCSQFAFVTLVEYYLSLSRFLFGVLGVCACVHACVRACVCVCVCLGGGGGDSDSILKNARTLAVVVCLFCKLFMY